MEPCYLSYFLSESTPAYGGEEGVVVFEKLRSIDNGDTSNNLKVSFPAHIGTHIDFPYHFSNEGKKCSDYPASFWIFHKIGFLECSVENLSKEILHLHHDIDLLILKTSFGKKRNQQEYWKSQPVIAASFAGIFRERFPFLRVFGFDMISLTSKQDRMEGKKAHQQFLLEYDILVLEDMNLNELISCPQKVIILPLQIDQSDGAPCSVIAI